jgi:hypothetical protein
LLARCDATAEPDPADRAWLDAGPAGAELL